MSEIKFEGGRNIAIKIPKSKYTQTVFFYKDILKLEVEEKQIKNPTISRTHQVKFGQNTLWLDCVDNYTHSETWLELMTPDVSAATDYLSRNEIETCDELEQIPADHHWIMDPAGTVFIVGKEDTEDAPTHKAVAGRMLTEIHPKLPMRNKAITKDYYINKLGFEEFGSADYEGYLMLQKDSIQVHFFEFKTLDPKQNYGQVYIRTDNIERLYQSLLDRNIAIHPNGPLQTKPWGQKEFSLLDPDHNLLTFGQNTGR